MDLGVDPFDWPDDLHWDCVRPRNLFNSRFLRHYDAAPKNPTPSAVAEALSHVAANFDVNVYETLTAVANCGDDFQKSAESAVRLWSSAGSGERQVAGERVPPIFKMVNRALIQDSESLQYWVTFVRALNSYLVNADHAPRRDIVCYRGSKMSPAQAAGLTKGRIVRPCMFFAMSTNRDVAEMYTGEDSYMLEVRVPRGCMNACPISHLARIEDEKEVLMPPYSPMLVRGHRRQTLGSREFNVIQVDVVDGRLVSHIELGRLDPSSVDMNHLRSAFRSPAQACIL